MTIELGQVYRDPITGFVGTATARAEYLYDTPNVRLTAETGQEDLSERWITESRLVPHEKDKPHGFRVN